MMKVGIDNVLISRMKGLSPNFARRYLSPKEYAIYSKLKDINKDSYLASRFAAKEAYVKASGDKKKAYIHIEVLDDKEGKPHLYVDGMEKGSISLTHDTIATAIIILD